MHPQFNYIARQRASAVAGWNNRLAMGDFEGDPQVMQEATISSLSNLVPLAMVPARRSSKGVKGRGPDVRKMLMSFGIGSYVAEMAIPQMFLLPQTTDPDAQATLTIIEGLQNGLNKVGANLEVNGLLTPATVQVLRHVAGRSWTGKTWLQIYGDVAEMIDNGMMLKPSPPRVGSSGPAMGEYTEIGDVYTAVPLAMLAGGLALLFLSFKG